MTTQKDKLEEIHQLCHDVLDGTPLPHSDNVGLASAILLILDPPKDD